MNEFIKDIFKHCPNLQSLTVFATSHSASLVEINGNIVSPRGHKLTDALKIEAQGGVIPHELKSFLVEQDLTLEQMIDIVCGSMALGPKLYQFLGSNNSFVLLKPDGSFKKIVMQKKE